jgi:hypothetical protein
MILLANSLLVDRIDLIEIENDEEVKEMSLNLKVGRSIPEETRKVAKAAFSKGNVYLWIGDELGELYTDHLLLQRKVASRKTE